MRENPSCALEYVAKAYFDRVNFGARELMPMAEVLWALQAASGKEIEARNGPRAWARRRSSDRLPIPQSKSNAGRKLVDRVAGFFKRGGPPGDDAGARDLAWRIDGNITMLARAAGWGSPSGAFEERHARIARRFISLRRRMRFNDPYHYALAALEGWGMSNAKAKDALRGAARRAAPESGENRDTR
jgi:hypothetical protein